MDMVVAQVAGDETKSVIDWLIAAPEKVAELLRATSMTAAVEALVHVKSHFTEVDMEKVG
jgi:hypothetical protein